MDIGIDSGGRQVHYKDAVLGKKYFCPHCTEKLILRGGEKPCFAHNVIKERTPLQRTCPEYHENRKYSKIINNEDIVYINNGGIPLYLCNDGNKFEIRAYFPTISEKFKKGLIENRTEVIIDNIRWCYVENLNYYIVYDIKNWIYVRVSPKTNYQEVKRKWLWGIRGIDIEKDIYYANKEGGYRLAIKANIYVGKKYRIMFQGNNPFINGIKFKKIGEIQLKKLGKKKVLYIYEMKITRFIEEAREFIEGKGYHLVEKNSKVIPLWPPAVCKGNDLTFDKDTAWFCHLHNNSEYFYEIEAGIISKLVGNKIFKVSNISAYDEKTIITMNKLLYGEGIMGIRTEIKYFLNYRAKLNNKNSLNTKIVIKDIEGQTIDYNQDNNSIPKDGRLFIESNIPIIATVKKDNYCLYSSKYSLEKISYGKTINIDCAGFGNIIYKYSKGYKNKKIMNQVDWQIIYKKLYECRGIAVTPTYKNKILLYKIKKNLNKENKNVYEILYTWIKNRKVPVDSQKLLDKMEGELND